MAARRQCLRHAIAHDFRRLIRCNSIRDTVQAQHKHIPREGDGHHSCDSEPQSSPSFAVELLGVHGSPTKRLAAVTSEGLGGWGARSGAERSYKRKTRGSCSAMKNYTKVSICPIFEADDARSARVEVRTSIEINNRGCTCTDRSTYLWPLLARPLSAARS